MVCSQDLQNWVEVISSSVLHRHHHQPQPLQLSHCSEEVFHHRSHFASMVIILSSGWSTGKVAFVQLADLLNIEVITLKSRPHPLRSVCPALYLSAPSRLLCQLVQHR